MCNCLLLDLFEENLAMADDGEEVVVEMQPMQKSSSSPYQQKEGDKTVALSWEDLVYEVPEVTGTIIKSLSLSRILSRSLSYLP